LCRGDAGSSPRAGREPERERHGVREKRYALLRLAERQRMPERFDAALAQMLGR